MNSCGDGESSKRTRVNNKKAFPLALLWLGATVLSLWGVACGSSGPPRTCEEAGKNYVQLKWPSNSDTDKKKRIDEFVSRCKSEKASQKEINCLANAKSKSDMDNCPHDLAIVYR